MTWSLEQMLRDAAAQGLTLEKVLWDLIISYQDLLGEETSYQMEENLDMACVLVTGIPEGVLSPKLDECYRLGELSIFEKKDSAELVQLCTELGLLK